MLFLAVIIIFLSGCISTEYNAATHRQDIFFYSTDKEITIGGNVAKQIAAKFKLSNDPVLVNKVNNIGNKLASVCDRKEVHYFFYIIDDDKKNAFSIPGGYVYIYKGLLDILDNDDEIAFVLGHEIGHIVCRHSIKRLQAAMGYNLLILASTQTKSPGFSRGLSFALAQIMTSYSRQDEFAADRLAVKYTKLAGYDPKAGIEVLEKLYREMKKSPDRPLSYFRTHPYAGQRIEQIKKDLGLPLTIRDYIGGF